MKLRPYQPDDLPALAQLYHDTIHAVARENYTLAQLEAWAPAQPDLGRWRDKLSNEDVLVAEESGLLVGFCSWDQTGYLDFLYVHHDHQRQGVAATLYAAVEQDLRANGLTRVHTQASVTAQPFFSRQGFRVVKYQLVKVRGVELPNAIMEKFLASQPEPAS